MTEKIKLLLNKFYSGTTSKEEEEVLKHFFKNNSVPIDYISDQQLFISLKDEEDTISDLEISSLIDNALRNEGYATNFKRGRRIRMFTTLAIAASLALLLGVSMLFTQDQKDYLYSDTFDDPYLAMQETQRVLALFARKMSIAQAELEPLEKLNMAQQALEPIRKMRDNLDYLEKIEAINRPMEMPILRHIISSDNAQTTKN